MIEIEAGTRQNPHLPPLLLLLLLLRLLLLLLLPVSSCGSKIPVEFRAGVKKYADEYKSTKECRERISSPSGVDYLSLWEKKEKEKPKTRIKEWGIIITWRFACNQWKTMPNRWEMNAKYSPRPKQRQQQSGNTCAFCCCCCCCYLDKCTESGSVWWITSMAPDWIEVINNPLVIIWWLGPIKRAAGDASAMADPPVINTIIDWDMDMKILISRFSLTVVGAPDWMEIEIESSLHRFSIQYRIMNHPSSLRVCVCVCVCWRRKYWPENESIDSSDRYGNLYPFNAVAAWSDSRSLE